MVYYHFKDIIIDLVLSVSVDYMRGMQFWKVLLIR